MKFYLCPICGNIVELPENDNTIPICCGQEMTLLVANSIDASFEKHVPYCKIMEDKVEVQIGEVIHPMEKEHYIMWIALVSDNSITKVNLKPSDIPVKTFNYIKDSTVYAYCNKHGLWKKEI